ncbi:hypothetical protein V6N13_144848 [Hibiscus sabdariffa]
MLSFLSPHLLPSFSFRAPPPRLPVTLRLKPPQLLSGRRRFLLPLKADDDNGSEENFDGALYLLTPSSWGKLIVRRQKMIRRRKCVLLLMKMLEI